ncbi:hypothetical protein ACV3J7_00120 [Salmonella enterica]
MTNALLTLTVTIPASSHFTGRVLVNVENGAATGGYTLDKKEHVASLTSFLELAEMAGFKVISPDE